MAPIGSKAVSKRKSLTVVDKLKVIELGSKSISQRKMAYELNISKSQVQQILKQKECIQERVNSGTLRLNAQIKVNLSKYPEIEHRCKPLPVSGALLQA